MGELTPTGAIDFKGTRIRMQRLKDMRFFGGWIKEINLMQIRVQLSTDCDIHAGDGFYVEMTRANQCASCRAGVICRDGDEIVLAVAESIRLFDAKESPRMAVNGMAGTLLADGVEYDIAVRDVSPEGIGIATEFMLARGSKVDVKVDTWFGLIRCSAEVRYCRSEEDSNGLYRIGLKIENIARLEKARWMMMFGSRAAA